MSEAVGGGFLEHFPKGMLMEAIRVLQHKIKSNMVTILNSVKTFAGKNMIQTSDKHLP